MTNNELLLKLNEYPRVDIGFYPTNLHRLNNISEDLGVNLYLKREDLSGPSTFGGNKIRKLRYLLADAKAKGFDTVMTYGASQSNHAMQTAIAARSCGMTPVLLLANLFNHDLKELRSNLLLDHIMGAEVSVVPSAGLSIPEAKIAIGEAGQELAQKKAEEGHPCYNIPAGGSSVIGDLGFVEAFAELMLQCKAENIKPDYLVHTSGSGGTFAGLAAGKAMLGEDTIILPIAVSDKDDSFEAELADMANKVLEKLASDRRVNAEDISLDRSYVGPGYEFPSEEGHEAIRYLAEKEGIMLDPIYSGKGFAGLLGNIRSGKIPKGSDVVFIHTGGATALFAESDMVGSIV